MAEILFLCHRIPYPPNKGDKIRSWHVLRHLARTHTVHLGCFIDAPEDWVHRSILQEICGECHFEPVEASALRWRNMVGLAVGKSVTESHFNRVGLRRWVEAIAARGNITGVYVFSSAMAQYLSSITGNDIRRVIDFVDLDSEKWRQYAEYRRPPVRWIYDLEARRLSAYERAMARLSNFSIFVTESEAEAFRRLAPESSAKAVTINNGVDTEYFSPDRQYFDPFAPGSQTMVFTGAMSYWANQDAVIWFASTILPAVRVHEPNAEFWVVGAGPNKAVKRLEQLPGVRVTGAVPDVRPYLANATAVVVPMRVGRGVQNKVLEAMAMARPIVASEIARSGLDAVVSDRELLVATTPSAFVKALRDVLSGSRNLPEQMGRRARVLVMAHYGWPQNLRRLDELFV